MLLNRHKEDIRAFIISQYLGSCYHYFFNTADTTMNSINLESIHFYQPPIKQNLPLTHHLKPASNGRLIGGSRKISLGDEIQLRIRGIETQGDFCPKNLDIFTPQKGCIGLSANQALEPQEIEVECRCKISLHSLDVLEYH